MSPSSLNSDKLAARDLDGSIGSSIFLANMSHEIRTPMNTILGYAQILSREAELSTQHQQNLEAVILSARHLLTLINDVLDISKLESGHMDVIESQFDMYSFFHSVEAIAHSRLSEKDLRFNIKIDSSVPRYVTADESKLRQIVVNIVSNAIKYTREGSVFVSVWFDSDQIYVRVSDTGMGISEEQLCKIFLPFERGDNSGDGNEGTGLGLSISHQFTSLLGGDLTATSTVGEGSDFELRIPVRSADELKAGSHSQQARVVGINGPSPRILVVDDNPENALLSSQFMKSIGFEVESVFDGESALRRCATWQPDIVLMDRRMPEMDGLAATRCIKDADWGKDIQVIIVSASSLSDEQQACAADIADGYIRKPYLEEELLKEVSRVSGVRYEYERQRQDDHEDIDPAQFEIPAEQREAMTSAAFSGDIDAVLLLIDELKVSERATAYLRTLARHYRYEDLINTLTNATTNATDDKSL